MKNTDFRKPTDGDKEITQKGPFRITSETAPLTPIDLILCAILLALFSLCGIVSVGNVLAIALPTAALYAAFCCKHSMIFNTALPLFGFIVGLCVAFDGYRAVGALLAGILAFCLFGALSNESIRGAKTASVTRCTLALWGYFLFLLLIYRLFHEDFSLIETFNGFFDALEQYWITAFETSYAASDFTDTVEQVIETANPLFALSDSVIPTTEQISETISYLVLQIRYLAPALLTVCFLMLSYVTASLFKLFCNLFRVKEPFRDRPYEITLSSVALLCYFVASLGALFAGGKWGVCFRNLSYILSPGFMLCGFKQIGVFFEQRGLSRGAVAAIRIAAGVLVLFSANLGTTVLILLGMLYTMNTELRKHGGSGS